MRNGFYSQHPIQQFQPVKIPKTNKKYTTNLDLEIPKQKWATFTYIGKKTTYITKIFECPNLKIAYCTNNSIQRNLNPNNGISNKYLASGMYKLPYTDCGKAYVVQTDRMFLQKIQRTFKSLQKYHYLIKIYPTPQ